MSLQMLVRCRRCGKLLTRNNVSILDSELCRECERKEMDKELYGET